MSPALAILSRWLHLTTAAILVGGVFHARIVLPIAARAAAPGDVGVSAVLRLARRVFKMAVHTSILFMLLSGTYNAVLYWPQYTHMGAGLGHSLFGLHLLLGLIAFGVLVWMYVGAEPPAGFLRWMAVVLALLLTTIAVASTLKYAREHAAAVVAAPTAPLVVTPRERPRS
jgi:uncharacterized membrane protein